MRTRTGKLIRKEEEGRNKKLGELGMIFTWRKERGKFRRGFGFWCFVLSSGLLGVIGFTNKFLKKFDPIK